MDHGLWMPDLAPSEALVAFARAATTEGQWRAFVPRYRAEMQDAPRGRLLALLAALSRQTSFSVGCYCADERRCHRSVLRELLLERDAALI